MELDERIYREICDLSQEGDQYLDDDNFELAEKKYLEALDLMVENLKRMGGYGCVALGSVYFLGI